MGVAPAAMTSQCGGPGDNRDCVVTRGAVPTLLTSGPGGGQALVRRRKELAQAHERGCGPFFAALGTFPPVG